MSSSPNEEDVRTWLKPYLDEKYGDYVLEIVGTPGKGEGYMGDVTFVRIVRNGEAAERLVVKSSKKSKQLRRIFPLRGIFLNEMNHYQEIAPEFRRFLKEKGIGDWHKIPECYHSLLLEDMEVLILEDMTSSGFHLCDRKKPMNRAHLDYVMENYARFHAISFALRDQNPQLFQSLVERFNYDYFKATARFFTERPRHFDEFIEYAKTIGEDDLAESAQKFQDSKDKSYIFAEPNDEYSVFLHGDCWNNNFMFTYESDDREKPSGMCMLDFQLSRVGSPVLDLSYFLFTCISEEDVHDFDAINQLYYSTLCRSISELGSDPHVLYPKEVFAKHWQIYSKMGVNMAPTLLKLCAAEPEDAVDLGDAADKGNMGEVFNKKSKDVGRYAYRLKAVLELAIEREFI